MTTSYETDENTPRAYTPEEVQDEFFSNIACNVKYWVAETRVPYDEIVEKLSGMMHSFHATTAGLSGGFSSSVDMRTYGTAEAAQRNIEAGENFFPVGVEGAVDINDGALKYHNAEDHVPEPTKVEGEEPREWNDDEMRAFFFNRVAIFIAKWSGKKNISKLDKGAGLFRDIFLLCEGKDPYFPAKIDLISTPHPEDKEYYLENGENYYEEETNLSTSDRSLVEAWDYWWAKVSAK